MDTINLDKKGNKRKPLPASFFNNFKRKSKHPRWKGGRKINTGYVYILRRNHPYSNKSHYIAEHRAIIEKFLRKKLNKCPFIKNVLIEIDGKMYLKPEIIVHHENEIRSDNRLENLKIFPSNSDHQLYHSRKAR